MAFTTVVTGPVYERFVEAIRKISARNGVFRLVMLLPSSDASTETWNVVFSAEWLDPLGIGSAITKMLDALRASLSPNAFSTVQRVSVLRTTEALVRELTSEISVELGIAQRVQSSSLVRFGIDEAIVLVSTAPNTAGALNTTVVHTNS